MYIIDTKDLRVPTLTLKRKCGNCGMILDMIRNFAKKVAVTNEVAIYTYYALVGGVVLQLVCFLRQKAKW